jgi:hypothetical protein
MSGTPTTRLMLSFVPVILVWIGHHRALRAGGHSFKSYWRDAWVK